jgi:hypothetical protein
MRDGPKKRGGKPLPPRDWPQRLHQTHIPPRDRVVELMGGLFGFHNDETRIQQPLPLPEPVDLRSSNREIAAADPGRIRASAPCRLSWPPDPARATLSKSSCLRQKRLELLKSPAHSANTGLKVPPPCQDSAASAAPQAGRSARSARGGGRGGAVSRCRRAGVPRRRRPPP